MLDLKESSFDLLSIFIFTLDPFQYVSQHSKCLACSNSKYINEQHVIAKHIGLVVYIEPHCIIAHCQKCKFAAYTTDVELRLVHIFRTTTFLNNFLYTCSSDIQFSLNTALPQLFHLPPRALVKVLQFL